jgi:UDP-2,4-diacetamido-2,4,6-trideoxy-beta-L-altropyranose hydrolase
LNRADDAATSSQTLVFRCDANPKIGTGHVMRCIALAQAWQVAGGNGLFAVSELPIGLEARLGSDGFRLHRSQAVTGTQEDAAATVRTAKASGAKWIVLDGDAFEVDFLIFLQEARLRVLLLDDFASRTAFPVDLILNPNLGASNESYRRAGFDGPLLVGHEYIPLRLEFTRHHVERDFSETAQRVMVTLGGSDPENLAPRISDALQAIKGLQVTIVAGASYEHWNELQQVAGAGVRVVLNSSQMPELMGATDLAITAAGGTFWELVYSGCAVLSYARNPIQARVVDLAAREGAAWDLGNTRNFNSAELVKRVEQILRDRELRRQMARAGSRMIDGMGAKRAIATLHDIL